MITVGLDFGTHQSKVCIEKKEGAELSYEFFMFKDADGKKQFTLPSIIHVDSSGHMTYGYLPQQVEERQDYPLLQASHFHKRWKLPTN